ncbi:unnamed protein product [Ambrosiozyma monospora]|uniref:Unnamed protein product n=1 Tax=Ambrosiozyma monospora TaxID=43982 RepID=A0ACB5T314_AMBMO|nr:unnamed protein product [Ambrosiozyma monospora]
MLSTPVYPTQIANIHSHSLSLPLQTTKQSMTQSQPPAQNITKHDPVSVTTTEVKSSASSITNENGSLKPESNTIKIGSRRSQLAVVQSEIVGSTIKQYYPNFTTPIVKVSTLGDQIQNKPLYSFGGKSLWTKELEILLYEPIGDFDQIDMIVHSLKDMPTVLPDEFELGCILEREGMF